MDKIEFNLDFIDIILYKGDIELALREIDKKDEDIDWDKSIKQLKEKMFKRIKWFMSEYEWDWFIDCIKEKDNGS